MEGIKIFFIVIFAIIVTFVLNLLIVTFTYWLICLLLGFSFMWRYAIAATIILTVLGIAFHDTDTKKK